MVECEAGPDPIWLHLYPTLHRFQRFQQFQVSIQGTSELILLIIHRMENFTFLVETRPAVCAGALLVFLLACACSVFCNAGRSSETFSQRVLRVLVLSCCGNGSESEARATPVDDGRPGIVILINSGLGPRKLHPVLRVEREESNRFTTGQKNYFFAYLMNVILGIVKSIAYSDIAQLRVPEWDVFYIVRPSECARPRALKICKVQFVTKHTNHKDCCLQKYTAPTPY